MGAALGGRKAAHPVRVSGLLIWHRAVLSFPRTWDWTHLSLGDPVPSGPEWATEQGEPQDDGMGLRPRGRPKWTVGVQALLSLWELTFS